uniref:Uncharacterized protein n=1 Tax=Trichogramma kaykai TaxID=54128 RepID=A0ABD2WLJ2_9HYME
MAPEMADNLIDLDLCENEGEPDGTERRVHFSSRVSTPISSPATLVHTTMSTTTCSTTCATTSTSTVMTTGARCFGDAANYSRASMLPPVRLDRTFGGILAHPIHFEYYSAERVRTLRTSAPAPNFVQQQEFERVRSNAVENTENPRDSYSRQDRRQSNESARNHTRVDMPASDSRNHASSYAESSESDEVFLTPRARFDEPRSAHRGDRVNTRAVNHTPMQTFSQAAGCSLFTTGGSLVQEARHPTIHVIDEEDLLQEAEIEGMDSAKSIVEKKNILDPSHRIDEGCTCLPSSGLL